MNQTQWTDREVYEAGQDRLRFGHYSRVLGEIVTEADTPLTIGIFGPWGSGKTSLMQLVRARLKDQAPPPLTVWFNAWKYDQEDALWRALVIQVLNAFRWPEKVIDKQTRHSMQPDMPPAEPALSPEEQELNQLLDDLEASLYRTVEREEVGGVVVDWDKLLSGSVIGLTHLSLSVLPGVGMILGKMMEEAQKKLTGSDLDTLFESIRRERRKIYREHIHSLEQFQIEFEKLVKNEVVSKGRRLVVFIDDLDRCLPEKAIEVLEALKLFLDVPGCVFFLGADQEVIQRGIRVKYQGFLVDGDDSRRIPISGDNYLEKIVQLPFHLLPLDEARVKQFIRECGVTLPDTICADIFAAGLEANPRRIKRALNIFHLLYKLAQIRQEEDRWPDQIKPQLLAKVVVIQNRYAQLYNDLVKHPPRLQEWERYFDKKPAAPATLAESGEPGVPTAAARDQEPTVAAGIGVGEPIPPEKYRDLQSLLSWGDRFADLSLEEVKFYLYLADTTNKSSFDLSEWTRGMPEEFDYSFSEEDSE